MSRNLVQDTSINITSETAVVNYEDYVGDSLLIELGYCDDVTKIPYDLQGYYIQLVITKNNSIVFVLDSVDRILLNHDDSNGFNIKCVLSPTETLNLGQGESNYYLTVKDTLDFVNTLMRGTITLKER